MGRERGQLSVRTFCRTGNNCCGSQSLNLQAARVRERHAGAYDDAIREWANANPAQRDALRAQRERTKNTVDDRSREGYLGMVWR